ncbi:MAG: Gp15 family bacteriophage protein [Candidatus Limiplasma sp.]|nr:Gp15 family bacteriophage protein [Candidatus Limiplasma sp.]
MNSLSLSRRPEIVLPQTLDVAGKTCAIRPDFRNILRIFRLLDDPEIADRHKAMKLVDLFYIDTPQPLKAGVEAFFAFLRGYERRHDPDAASIDYEFDADVIYASFLHAYRIDLLDPALTMHWYAFTGLINGLTDDSALCERLRLRKLDTKHLKGKAKTSAEIARRNAQPPKKISETERELQSALTQALREGKDPNTLLGYE